MLPVQVWDTDGAITRVAFSSRGRSVAAAAEGKAADNSVQVFRASEAKLDPEEAASLLGHRGQGRSSRYQHNHLNYRS